MDFNGFNGWVLIVIWHHLTRNCGFQWISPREMINQEAGFNYETWSSDMWFTTYRLHHGCHELTSMWSSLQWIICPFSTAHRELKRTNIEVWKTQENSGCIDHFSSIFHSFFIHVSSISRKHEDFTSEDYWTCKVHRRTMNDSTFGKFRISPTRNKEEEEEEEETSGLVDRNM